MALDGFNAEELVPLDLEGLSAGGELAAPDAMKQAAGRDLDLIVDIAELERARGAEEPGR